MQLCLIFPKTLIKTNWKSESFRVKDFVVFCPISFNIYGKKINKRNFSSGTVIIHFLDKPYQEINFKSYLNSVLLCKQEKILSDLHMSTVIQFNFTCLC